MGRYGSIIRSNRYFAAALLADELIFVCVAVLLLYAPNSWQAEIGCMALFAVMCVLSNRWYRKCRRLIQAHPETRTHVWVLPKWHIVLTYGLGLLTLICLFTDYLPAVLYAMAVAIYLLLSIGWLIKQTCK